MNSGRGEGWKVGRWSSEEWLGGSGPQGSDWGGGGPPKSVRWQVVLQSVVGGKWSSKK